VFKKHTLAGYTTRNLFSK